MTLQSNMSIKNDLFLRALKGETVNRPPVWMMRQAGRYLPEFMEIKAKYDFFTRCQTPELASEITVQPIRRYGMDAAILFSDILVIPQAMNIEVQMKPNFGPYLPNPIRSQKDVDNVIVPDVKEALNYVYQAIKATKEKLNNEIVMLQQQADNLTNKISLEADVTRELASLERDLSVNTTLYHDLLNRHEMAKVTGELGRFEEPEKIKIIDRAFTPIRASNMPFAVFVVLGMVIGLVVGCAIAIIAEVLDDTIWHESQISAIAKLDVICRIPEINFGD